MFEYLNEYRVILVSGSQRSGTTIATQMIAQDTGRQAILEEDFGVTDRIQWDALVQHGQNIVIQCPTMMRYVHEYPHLDDMAAVIMRRDLGAIHASMERIGWFGGDGETYARAAYAYPVGDIAQHKYDYFEAHQRDSIPHLFEVPYESLAAHPLWIPASERVAFDARQTERTVYHLPYTLVVTPGYRLLGPAILSHAKAARRYVDIGGRFDWLTLYGMPDSLPLEPHGHDVVTRKYQIAQELFLNGAYDRFICIEDDMVIPEDTFERLHTVLNDGADIAYGLYVWRGAMERSWSVASTIDDKRSAWMIANRDQCAEYFRREQIVETKGVGMGVTAFRREVLEAIPFVRRGDACCDWYMSVDAQHKGFVQKTDFGLVCGHLSLTPSPRIQWPDITDMQTMQKVELL